MKMISKELLRLVRSFSIASLLGLAILGNPSHAQNNACLEMDHFGADPTGRTFSDRAWNAAVAAVGSENSCFQFGAGNFKFSEAASITLVQGQAIKIVGAGKEVTRITWPSGGGILLKRNVQSTFTIQDLSLLAGEPGAGDAIGVVDVSSNKCAGGLVASAVLNVSMRGADGIGQTDYWNAGIAASDLNLLNVFNVDIFGESTNSKANGILYEGNSAASCLAVVNNVMSSYFQSLANGYIMGDSAQGVTISQSNFNSSAVGVSTQSGAQLLDQLTISNSQFNTTNAQIAIVSTMDSMIITGNLFFVPPNQAGLDIAVGCFGCIISNNFFTTTGSTGGWGVFDNGSNGLGFNGGTITGNVYTNLVFGNQFTNAIGWNVQSNTYQTVATPNDVSGGCTSCTIGGGTP
jgi:hypothetical protein